MTSTTAATSLSLTVIRASQIKWVSSLFHSERPSLYVQIKFNDIKARTQAVNLDLFPQWDESFPFEHPPAGGEAKFFIQIKHSSSWKDKCVGKVEVELDDLLQRCANGKEAELHLKMPHNSKLTEITAILHLRLGIVDTMSGASQNVNAAEQVVQRSGIPASIAAIDSGPVAVVDDTINHYARHADLYKSVEVLLSKLDVFMRAIDTISQVHPYADFAWKLVSALYKTVKHQFEVDKKMVDLVHAMRDAFDFVEEANILRDKTKRLKSTIIQLLRQTNECCLFIRKYAYLKFLRRIFLSNTDETIDGFLEAFRSLKSSIDSENILSIAFVSTRISTTVDAVFLRGELKPAEMDAFHRSRCLSGTRRDVLKEIVEWASLETDQNIFWLYGVAGSGKSTISTTIAEYFRVHTVSRLGAHLFFERGKSDDPSTVIRTLAFQLASFDSYVEEHVRTAVDQDRKITESPAATQFEHLLRSPLNLAANAMRGPIVIVLDALDECGSKETRRELLESFGEGLPSLPQQFRFLITSRKEPDISEVLSSMPNCIIIKDLEHDSLTCKDDVLHYIDHEMRKVIIKRSPAALDTDNWRFMMARLGDAAGGLFIWASTAVRLVDNTVYPAKALKELASKANDLCRLDNLYSSVLTTVMELLNKEQLQDRFVQIMGLILLSKIPMTDAMIDGILDVSPEEPSSGILSQLFPVLAYEAGKPIRLLHTSFRDYLLSPECGSNPWCINLEAQKGFIASQCFKTMSRLLQFNICKIESSYIPNDQISNLLERIKENIPSHLDYVCLFWSQHLLDAQFSDALLSELSEFLHKRFLYWLEVMSLLKKANTTSPALLLAMNWVSSHNADSGITAFLKDARRIITAYFPSISQSTPRIYVSFLPLASMESKFLADNYIKPDLPIVHVERTGVKQRSPLLKKLDIWGDVHALTFSPDNMRIAGHFGYTIQIWDGESGQVISGPFKGRHSQTSASAFSPNLERLVSTGHDTETGTQGIRIWEVESGKLVFESLGGHTDEILVVAFSPDGMHVVSGSADTTVVVWKIDSKEPTSVRFAGHAKAVCSIAFSYDGKCVVSGSDDLSIRLWRLERRRPICEPLEGHTDSVISVAFSRDGTRVVSGSADSTLRIWDARNGQCIYGPFKGHTSRVRCVAFSPNGKRVVSGSADKTVRIWNVETGKVISGPYEGHFVGVNLVAFSPDGTRVVSGAYDAIRIWDAEGEQANSGQLEGHEDCISSVAFSPDGKLVASGSLDGAVRVWDSESGCTVSGPFIGLSEQSESILSVSFSPDGGRIVSGSGNGTILAWDVGSGAIVSGPFKGHEGWVESVSFSADGTRVISGSMDDTIRVWDVHDGQTISVSRLFLRGTQDIEPVVSLSDEGRIDFGSQDIREDRRTSDDQERHYTSSLSESDEEQDGPGISSIAISSDGSRAVSGFEDGTIIIWAVESGEAIAEPLKGHEDRICSVAFSRDGTNVVSGDDAGTIIIWDAESGQVVSKILNGHNETVTSLAFSSDGTRIVSGSWDRTIRVWDVKSGQAIFAPFEGHTDAVWSVAFSPDGSRVVSGSHDRTIRIWNVKDPVFDWTLDRDGWIRGPKGEMLFWVHPDDRRTLWRPQNTAVFNCPFLTKLNFTNAALGEQWQKIGKYFVSQ